MDEKLFKLIEIVFIGGALIAVIYLGGFFGPVESLGVIGTPQIKPVNLTDVARQTTAVATLGLTQFPALNLGASATPTPQPEPTLTPRPNLIVTATPWAQNYQIEPGDTCLAIADKFGITLEILITVNSLDAECRILAGDTLKIPLPVTDSP